MTILVADAKLTTSLRLTGVRPDGYHLIEAEMVTVDLADRLEITPGDGLEIVGGDRSLGADDDNLVRRALALVGATAHVRLEKHIPAGAGLGGGSADAAAILRWADQTDRETAAMLGADVPFCVVGGRARVSGIGEIVEPLDHVQQTFTLFTPSFSCSTPAVYAAWDDLGGPAGDNGNDLEPAALVVEPRLAEARDHIVAATGRRPRLAGSGSTWFLEGVHRDLGGRIVTTTPGAGSARAI